MENNKMENKRHLPLEGGYNFRDLGGYPTADGRMVKWNTVFRADDLGTLTENDLEYLAGIPLVSIVDFRGAIEMEKAPDLIPVSVKEVYNYSIMPGNMDVTQMQVLSETIPMEKLMEKVYTLLVTDPEIIDQYRKFFALLQNSENTPLLFHCSAGKDRTGMAAALFLLSLGVDEETVIEDYLLSNKYVEAKYAPMVAQYPQYKPAFIVDRNFIEIALNQIKTDHGSVENYLKDILHVDLEKIKKLYSHQ
ncbi:MAG: tyrosine-protein phosphatase [Bacteroidales bacterium]|nr:tyrosine-protein phosphatase [Bacteroidales bacterium]